jgi:UDP-glucose 4-epimerase|tara:strand:+ start:2694 stop:3725 length:1032 start_codon:yes stop_codon:yes gene_type:complete
MVKVLVTGSHGFIGSYICQDLLDSGYEVLGIDNFSKYGKVSKPFESHPNFTFLECDARDLDRLDHQVADVDYIIAGAAMIGGITYFHKYAYDLLATNERILASTFDLAIKLWKDSKSGKANLKRIIVLSSSMVFECTKKYPTPETEVLKCPPPMSTYGFQKLASEYFCKGAYEQYGLPYTVIRPFNCVGIGEDEALGAEEVEQGNIKMLMSHVLPDLIYKALHLNSDDELPILGSGHQIRHYTNGKDIARGIRVAMESSAAENDDFNISSPEPTAVAELAEIVWRKIHGTPLKLKHEDSFTYDVQLRSPNVEKAMEKLGFKTEIGLEESVEEVIVWMRKQHGL